MHKPTKTQIDYTNYLQLDNLLSAQTPETSFHEEMLFIITHQTYELWFKQILFEIDSIMHLFSKSELSDTDIFKVLSRIQRIIKIQKLMIDQFTILETMTPMDFLEFRDALGSASGFESYQFRLLEVKLGVKYTINSPPLSRLSQTHLPLIAQALSSPSLLTLVDQWLSRTPFLYINDFTFWQDYQSEIKARHANEKTKIENNEHLTTDEKLLRLNQIQQIERHFTILFDSALYDAQIQNGEKKLSQRAMHAALLIHIYRDQPAFHLPYLLLSALVDIDERLSGWRSAHILIVQRMIGQRLGTGSSSGQQYLTQAMQSRKVFSDLTHLASFLISGSRLSLPTHVQQKLGLAYAYETYSAKPLPENCASCL